MDFRRPAEAKGVEGTGRALSSCGGATLLLRLTTALLTVWRSSKRWVDNVQFLSGVEVIVIHCAPPCPPWKTRRAGGPRGVVFLPSAPLPAAPPHATRRSWQRLSMR